MKSHGVMPHWNSYISVPDADAVFVGGMMAIVPEMGPMPSSWTVYFTTKNLEKSRQVAKENGAHELSPVIDLPNISKLIVIKDVVGAVFSLFEWAPKMYHRFTCPKEDQWTPNGVGS